MTANDFLELHENVSDRSACRSLSADEDKSKKIFRNRLKTPKIEMIMKYILMFDVHISTIFEKCVAVENLHFLRKQESENEMM